MKQNINIVTALACGLFAAVLTGCVKEHDSAEQGMTQLQVVGIALEQASENGDAQRSVQTRATEINKTFTFEHGDALSLFMRGTTYTDVDNRKVTYDKPGAAAGTWAIEENPILLSNQTAVVSLVHPYTAGAAYNNIPFATGVYTPAIDLLWKQQTVDAATYQAQVTQMQHALTRLKFVVKRDDPANTAIPDRYTGAGAVTSVSIANGAAPGTGTSAAVFTTGKLDLSFIAPASPVTGVTPGTIGDDTSFTLSTTGHTTDLLTLPIAAPAQDLVTLGITVDGMPLATSLPFAAPAATKWESGKCYTYTITVRSKGIEITSCTVDNWSEGATGDSEVEIPAPPVLTVDPNGILTFDGKMLFFQFGSVVGFTQEGDWAADKVLFNPTTTPDYSNYTTIPVYSSVDWNANRKNISDPTYHNGANIQLGKGDPCKLVGLSISKIQTMTEQELTDYNSGWHLPTYAEIQSFTGHTSNGYGYQKHWTASDSRYENWYFSGGSAGAYLPKGSEEQQKYYLPAAGARMEDGSSLATGTFGRFLSNEAHNATTCHQFSFNDFSFFAYDSYESINIGYGVRCVKNTPTP